MSDLRKFVEVGAKAMAVERPDIFDEQKAARDIMRWFGELQDEDEGLIGSGGYLLEKSTWHDGSTNVEYRLVREVVSYDLFPDEDSTHTFNWLTSSAYWDFPDDANDLED